MKKKLFNRAQAQILLKTTRTVRDNTIWWENQEPETAAYQVKQKWKEKQQQLEFIWFIIK